MNARAIMGTGSRESFTALIAEVLEDPGTGYARLRNAHDDSDIWEINLLPLRSDFGMIDRVIGCLHPLSKGRTPHRAGPLRFRIEQMNVEPVIATVGDPNAATPLPLHGFAEAKSTFDFRENTHLTDTGPRFRSIEGGLNRNESAETSAPSRGHLRLVED